MLDLYRGLSRYEGSLCATFALSDAVKKGFNTDDPGYRHADVAMVPEYLLVDLSVLDEELDETAQATIDALDIRLDAEVLQVVKQSAVDALKRKGGLDSLPVSDWRNTIRIKGPEQKKPRPAM